ncbi:MAG: nucleoside monophosphate kinase [Candidatus Saccharimonadales bacterium]
MKIFGLAGTHASGKDTIADLLVSKYGYFHVSTGDIFREEATKRYGSIERPVLYKTANEIRNKDGYGAVSFLALQRYEAVKEKFPNGLVVSGFRALEEAKVIKEAGGIIVFVDADADIRFKRMKDRARAEESDLSREEFNNREDAENGQTDPAFNILAIKDIADITINNNGDSIENFKNEVEAALGISG